MRTLITTCLMMLLLYALPGCKSVVSDHLIGESLDAEEAKAYEGVWRINDGMMHVKHIEGGGLVAAGLEWKADHYEVNELHTTVTVLDAMRIAQIVEEKTDDQLDLGPADSADTAQQKQTWVLLGLVSSSGDDSLVIHAPNFDRFEQAINAGELRGEITNDGNKVHILGDKAALDAFMSAQPLTDLFRMQDPQVMTRIGGSD